MSDEYLYETLEDKNKFDQSSPQVQAIKWLKYEIDT